QRPHLPAPQRDRTDDATPRSKDRSIPMMYCQKCATENIDNARFCRACGVNLSLVPQALSGQTPQPEDVRQQRQPRSRRSRRRRRPHVGRGITRSFVGLAFLTIVVASLITNGSPGGLIWLLIPAFILLGKG